MISHDMRNEGNRRVEVIVDSARLSMQDLLLYTQALVAYCATQAPEQLCQAHADALADLSEQVKRVLKSNGMGPSGLYWRN